MSFLTTSIQHHIEDPGYCNNTSKGNKIYAVWKRRNKLFLFADGVTVYVENPKELTNKKSPQTNK